MLGLGDPEKELARDFGSGLNDVLGRGTIAGLIGLPGDLGGLAENGIRSALGMPQVTPYGGSEHIGQVMEQAGLVSPVRRPKTELLASLISPSQAASAAYRAPQMARAGVRALDNFAAPRTMGSQTGAIENLWHGSPHTFDRFDLSKIGTGEGAQAYGHGAYLAESPDVAKSYKIAGDAKYADPNVYANMLVKTYSDSPENALKVLNRILPPIGKSTPAGESRELIQGAINSINSGSYKSADAGNLYQTRLAWPDPAREAADPLSPDHFLHWDKPLSEQPDSVLEVLKQYGDVRHMSDDWNLAQTAETIQAAKANQIQHLIDDPRLNMTGSDVLGLFGGAPGMPSVEATNRLRAGGIPGIRYLDGGSRGAGAGSHNYVVFDDRLIDIVSRNGQPVGNLGKMVAPQDEALRAAQQNAAKPIEEGGLGLRPDNTPEERAAAMGFDIDNPMAHGTDKNFRKFKVGKGGYDELGSGVYAAPIDSRPNGYTYSNAWAQGDGGVNYPVVVKSDIADYDLVNNALPTPVYRTPDGVAISPPSDVEAELMQRIIANDPQWLGYEDLLRDRMRDIGTAGTIKKAGYAGARSQNSQVPNQVVTFDPRNIRSRFAAFDPMRRDSSDILAGLAPLGLGAWMYQDEPVK